MEDIVNALQLLDVDNDDHWTNSGAPSLSAVAEIMGVEKVSRKAVSEAAPHFSREAPFEELQEQSPETADEDEEAPVLEQDEEPVLEEQTEAPGQIGSNDPELQAAIDAYNQAQVVAAEAQEELNKAGAYLNQMSLKHRPEASPRQNQLNIQAYLQSQVAEREAKAEAEKELEAEFGPGFRRMSPVDMAMRRRHTRASQRPAVPLLKGE